jgi:hypothetical protein
VPGGGGGGPEVEAAELLGALGSLVSVPQQAQRGGAAASPLLPSVGKAPGAAGRPPLGGLPAGAAGAEQDKQAAEQEAAAVKAFLRRLPQQGIGRRELATVLLCTLCDEAAAAALGPPARQHLLQLAHAARHDVPHLPPATCLVLGELFVDAAAAAARERALGAGPWQAAAHHRPPSLRRRRSELALEQLQQCGCLWLMRYRLATAEAPPHEGDAAGQLAAPAAQQQEAQQQRRQQAEGGARGWWAMGRLREAAGDIEEAAAAYANCAACLGALGEPSARHAWL